jgi:hypothetical protein
MTTKLFFKTVDGRYISLDNNVKDMQKARVTKYVKRVPKPSGKGYYYFYTKQKFQDYKDKGIVPKEEKERKGILGAWSALADYFGITGNRNSDETAFRTKIQDEYSKHEKELKQSGADVSTFAQHLNEFLSNKEKWLAKFSGEKKEKGEAKPKSEQPKSEKKESTGASGQKWNMSVMKTIAGIYGGGEKEKSGSEKFKEAAKESVDNMKNAKSQKIVNFKGDDTDYHVVDSWTQDGIRLYRVVIDEKIDQFDNTKDTDKREVLSEVIPASEFEDKKESKDNFDTMPEGEDKKNAESDKKYGKIADEIMQVAESKGFKEGNSLIKISKTDLDKILSKNKSNIHEVMSRPYDNMLSLTKLNDGNYAFRRKPKLEEFINPDQKPSATEAKEIERTERFPDVPTYAEVPEGFKKVEGTTAPKGYEFYRNGSPLSKDYKQVLVKDKSKVEALKEELGKKKSESKSDIINKYQGKYKSSKYSSVNKYVNDMLKNMFDNTSEQAFENAIKQGTDIDKIVEDRIKGFEKYSENLQKDIENKDYKKLIEVLHTGNKSSRAMFQEISGIDLGTTNKSMEEAVAKFVGQDKVKSIKDEEKARQDARKKAESDAKEAENKKKYEILGSWGDTLSAKEKGLAVKQLEKQFRSSTGKVRSAKDVIDEKIAEGWKVFKDEDGRERFMHPDGKQSMGGTMGNATINKYAVYRAKEKQGKNTEVTGSAQDRYDQALKDVKEIEKEEIDISNDGKINNMNPDDYFIEYFGEKNSWDDSDKKEIEKIKRLIDSKKNLSKYKEEAMDESGQGKMFKALSNLREELMFKAATTKYIKRIPNPKGKGYIYFYTPEQVKAYEKDGTLPDQKKEGEEKKPESDKKQILKDSLKKIASIFSDALSGKDTVQPTGSGVEQAGEKISADQKAKKRLEENKKKSESKPLNKPEEKPKK